MPIVVPAAIGVAGIVMDTAAGTAVGTAAGTVMGTAAGTAVGTAAGTVVGTAADAAVGTLGFAACNPCFLLLLSILFVYHCVWPIHPLQFKLNIVAK